MNSQHHFDGGNIAQNQSAKRMAHINVAVLSNRRQFTAVSNSLIFHGHLEEVTLRIIVSYIIREVIIYFTPRCSISVFRAMLPKPCLLRGWQPRSRV